VEYMHLFFLYFPQRLLSFENLDSPLHFQSPLFGTLYLSSMNDHPRLPVPYQTIFDKTVLHLLFFLPLSFLPSLIKPLLLIFAIIINQWKTNFSAYLPRYSHLFPDWFLSRIPQCSSHLPGLRIHTAKEAETAWIL